MTDNRSEIREWLRGQLEKVGYGAKSALARHLNVRPDRITRILNEQPGKETSDIRAFELVAMGEFFGSTPPGLGSTDVVEPSVVPSKTGLQPVVSAGIAAAGLWREFDDLDQSEREVFWEPADPHFPNARLLSYDVEGDSMNDLKPRPIFDGDRAIALAYEDVQDRVPLRDGMVVVVQRMREGGHILELSIKQIEFYQDRIEFHPRSTNPKHKPIVIRHEDDPDIGTTVSVIAWVRRINNNLP